MSFPLIQMLSSIKHFTKSNERLQLAERISRSGAGCDTAHVFGIYIFLIMITYLEVRLTKLRVVSDAY